MCPAKVPLNITNAHYFTLPSQGNVYSLTNLCMSEGVNKILVASLKRKVFSFEYTENNGLLKPTVKEVPFTYIPSGAEIISIDAFNKSPPSNDFVIGITIVKVADPRVSLSGDQQTETYLNIYSEWEPSSEFNLDSVAQSCLSLELQFIPYQLYHTTLPPSSKSAAEVVWLLSGSDEKVHMYREDRQNHCYQDAELAEFFPELCNLESIAFWLDVRYTSDIQKRITAIGCENGTVLLSVVNTSTLEVTSTHEKCYEGPISSVRLFFGTSSLSTDYLPPAWRQKVKETNQVPEDQPLNLLVTNGLQPSAVYMNVLEEGLENFQGLSDSGRYDSVICSCIADIDMDGHAELLLGTYGQEVLVYKQVTGEDRWQLSSQSSLSNPIFSLAYLDLTGDGVGELIALTLKGVHVLQHNLEEVQMKLHQRMKALFMEEKESS